MMKQMSPTIPPYLGSELLEHTFATIGHLVEDVGILLIFVHPLDALESTSVICVVGADFQHHLREWVIGIKLSEIDLLHVDGNSGFLSSCRCGAEAGNDEEEGNREDGGTDHLCSYGTK